MGEDRDGENRKGEGGNVRKSERGRGEGREDNQ